MSDRLERERMAGYERPRVVSPPVVKPQFPAAINTRARAPPTFNPALRGQQQATQQQQASSSSTISNQHSQQTQQALHAQQAQHVQANATSADALGQAILKKVHQKIEEETRQLRGVVDSVTLRSGSLENSLKSLEHSVAALREEFSGIAQVAGGSVAKKADDVDTSLKILERSFAEFSTRVATDNIEAERRQGVMREELLSALHGFSDADARAMAQAAYERSITTTCRITSPEGVNCYPIEELAIGEEGTEIRHVKFGELLVLRYPMKPGEDADSIYMTQTIVTADGDVLEFSIPIQISGIRTVEFLSP